MNKMNIIFDLDGTLINPEVAICTSINYALEKKGHPVVEHKSLHRYIGKHLLDPFRDITGIDDEIYLWEMISDYRERYETIGIKENSLYPGIEEMITSMGSLNYIASIKPGHASRMILTELGIDRHFKGIYGSKIDGTRSDKTELLHYIKDKEKINTAIMIGDRDTDVYAAKSCGYYSIGVCYGYGSLEEIKNSEPDLIVDDSRNLKCAIEDIWKKFSC